MSNEKKGFTDLSLKHLINKIKSTFINKEDVVSTSTIDVDTTPTENSENLVTSGGVAEALNDKQDILAEGTDYLNPTHIEELIDTIRKASFVVVEELPTPSELTMGKIYLIPSESEEPKEEDSKDEYITIKNSNIYSWEKIGNTNINLDNYYTKEQIDGQVKVFTQKRDLPVISPDQQPPQWPYYAIVLHDETNNNKTSLYQLVSYSAYALGWTFMANLTTPDLTEYAKKTEVSAEIAKSIEEHTDPKGTLTIDGTEYTASKQTITIVTNGVTSTFDICALS